MNKDEIKKALKCCAEDCCSYCPVRDVGYGCQTKNLTTAIDLITEQEQEIERLKAECEYRKKQHDNQVAENTRLHIEYDKAFERLKAQQREIDALKDENEELEENLDMLIKEQKGDYNFEIKQAKIDVLNELKNRLVVYYPSVISEIDELVKELIK